MRVRGAAATCTKQEDAAVTSCLCYCQPATEGLNQIYTGTQGPPRKTLLLLSGPLSKGRIPCCCCCCCCLCCCCLRCCYSKLDIYRYRSLYRVSPRLSRFCSLSAASLSFFLSLCLSPCPLGLGHLVNTNSEETHRRRKTRRGGSRAM